jgi:hypothetical protein
MWNQREAIGIRHTYVPAVADYGKLYLLLDQNTSKHELLAFHFGDTAKRQFQT